MAVFPFQPSNLQPQPLRSPALRWQPIAFEVTTVDGSGQIVQRQQHSAEVAIVHLGNGVNLEMVSVPGGRFQMGSPESERGRYIDESPLHAASVAPFYCGRYAVTQAQWQAVAVLPGVKLDLPPDPAKFKGDRRPVERVNWQEAVEFCNRLSQLTGDRYRLPSEAEWEYACRAGTTTPFHFGPNITDDLANFNRECHSSRQYSPNCTEDDYPQETCDVGKFPPNRFGLHEMHGNVWEWCGDRWHINYSGAPANGSLWQGGVPGNSRVLRGGCWNYFPKDCRSAMRSRIDGGYRGSDVGFRVACSSISVR
ncbi:formylglycine-generating enzyme family protein [Synechococcus sp. PCC 7336]|uniref:formylglycine-generating enzyme family protein n=1 Tax=Synechococcus sp. PCC 7336 TaxID=195250 RepID=UPI00034898D4|nr:formylglycine-generating enzyme family protein [Synechococcus sp. PCC 7336]